MGIAYPTSISMISTNKVFNDFNLSCGGILHRTISTIMLEKIQMHGCLH
jgi:hypothetical protein